MYNLFAILQMIVQSYSHLPINDLFENPLSVTLFFVNTNQVAKDLLKHRLQGLSKAKTQLFLKGGNYALGSSQNLGTKNERKTISNQKLTYIYLSINHKKLLPLHKHLLLSKSKKDLNQFNKHFVENLICLTTQNQIIDNILSFEQKIAKETMEKRIKGFFFHIPNPDKDLQTISDQVSLFLSISEFFHSHIGMVLSIHEVNEYQALESLIQISQQQFEEDDDQILSISVYCRIFQALPFKITYDDIASLAQIQVEYWGETIRIEQGTDGILFWFLLNHSPILFDENIGESMQSSLSPFKLSVAQKTLAQKYGLKLSQQQYGHLVLKSKTQIKESLENLSLTIVIINLKRSEYCMNIDKIFGPIFQKQVKKYSQTRVKERDFQLCEKIEQEVDRLSELLAEIPTNTRTTDQKQLFQQAKEADAQQLAYSIKRWLLIKGKQ